MASDSIYAGPILWEGSPKEIRSSPLMRVTGWLAYGLGVVSMAFAVVRGLWFEVDPTALLFAIWSVTLGAIAHGVPNWWRAGARYRVTRDYVIWSRGPFRRVIERSSISYARIVWSPRLNNVGTLELVRAVPAGALSRRLALCLDGIESPDGVLAIIRDAHDVAPAGRGDLPLTQRLDRGERILWAAKPLPSLRAYLPVTTNQWSLVALTLCLFGIGTATVVRGVAILERLATAGFAAKRLAFSALIVGMGITALCIFVVGYFIVQNTLVYRARMLHHTRYLISNKRVLIQRGREELHLDRRMIVEIIETPAGAGKRNLYLVLDGPRSRALASSGAFGERHDQSTDLLPVFEWLVDGEGARLALELRPPSLPPLPWAA